MDYRLKVEYTRTGDELKLQGMHYAPKKKEVGVVFVHGMSGNFVENDYADVMGKTLAKNGIGYIYGHNRGYGHINDIVRGKPKPTGDNESSRQGAWYESFSHCPKDIDAWINQAVALGYKKLIVIGHSLGCSKVIYWWQKTKWEKKVVGGGLVSPVDMVGSTMTQFTPKEFEGLIEEAKALMAKGKYTNLLSKPFDNGWYNLSANTFMEEMVSHCPADVLPIYQPENKFEALAKIKVPILMLYGDHELNKDTAVEDLALLKKKATSSAKVETKIIAQANHSYEGQEVRLSKTILKWIKTL